MGDATYNISFDPDSSVLTVGFGRPAQNDEIVRDAKASLDEMTAAGQLAGGPIIKINGPASLPVAVVVAHAVGHIFETVAVFDPKLGSYVVAIAHGGTYAVGDLIPG